MRASFVLMRGLKPWRCRVLRLRDASTGRQSNVLTMLCYGEKWNAQPQPSTWQATVLAQIEGRRHNPVSIRLRIIDPDFQGMDRIAREPEIWQLLKKLPEEVFVNITMLLLLTPEEVEHSLASQEFDHPIPSRV